MAIGICESESETASEYRRIEALHAPRANGKFCHSSRGESKRKQQTLDVWRSYTVYLEKINGVYKILENCV